MKRRLILHIGAHRTATTALQHYLQTNARNLQTKGFIYPFKERRHLQLMNDLFSGWREVSEVAQTLNARADSRKHKIETVILSDEDICTRQDLGVLAKFRKWFDVFVVFTLRRQDTWLESWYYQNIKWQWNPKLSHCTFDEFMEMREDFHWIRYDRYVAHLEKLFGKKNIILNVHEKGQMPDGPILAFCESIGLTDREEFSEPAHINASFSPQMSEFMRCIPLGEAPISYRKVLTKACAKIDQLLNEGGAKQAERLLSASRRQDIMADYSAGNRAVANKYFGRDELFLEELPKDEGPLADMKLPADSYDLMRAYVEPLISEIIRHQMENDQQQKDM